MIEVSLRRDHSDGAVPTLPVVEAFDVVEDGGLGNCFGMEGSRIGKHLGFEGGEAAFGEGVVVAITFGTHALSPFSQSGSKWAARILAASVGMEDRSGMNRHPHAGLVDGPNGLLGAERFGEIPSENEPGEQIHDNRKVEPALGGRNIGDVGYELLSGARRLRGLLQKIG